MADEASRLTMTPEQLEQTFAALGYPVGSLQKHMVLANLNAIRTTLRGFTGNPLRLAEPPVRPINPAGKRCRYER